MTKLILFIYFISFNVYSQTNKDSLSVQFEKIAKEKGLFDNLKIGDSLKNTGLFPYLIAEDKNFKNTSDQYKYSLTLSISILVFGLIIILGVFYNLNKQGKGWGTNTVQIVSITLLIVAGLFLITAGYSQQQITPVVGLLGTIAGYLLGKSSDKDK